MEALTAPAPPAWHAALADAYLTQAAAVILVHGNTQDAHWLPGSAPAQFLPLRSVLARYFFAQRDYVLSYHPKTGLKFANPATQAAYQAALDAFPAADRLALDRLQDDVPRFVGLLEHFARHVLQRQKSLGLILEAAEQLLPPVPEQPAIRNTMRAFATEGLFKQNDFTALLIAENLLNLDAQLLEVPGVAHVRVPRPTAAERHRWLAQHRPETADPETIAQTAGLRLVDLEKSAQTAAQPQAFAPAPEWGTRLQALRATRSLTQFILHGNTVDLVRHAQGAGPARYVRVQDYLAMELFADTDLVLYFDRAAGVDFRGETEENDFFVRYFFEGVFKRNTERYEGWLRKLKDPGYVFGALERYIEDRLAEGKSLALIVEFAETLVPAAAGAGTPPADRVLLVYFQKWAKASRFLQGGFTAVLLTDDLQALHPQLVRNPYSAALLLDYPTAEQRLRFISDAFEEEPVLAEMLDMPPEVLARDTAGLTLVQLRTLLADVRENRRRLTFEVLRARKKAVIESEAGGLLAFVESPYTLDAVAGHAAAKLRLRQASEALKAGRGDVLPMGYLVSGPVGTGKSFLVKAFAGEIGVPMVELKNFRGQYVGQTEANLERLLRILKALSPVAVMIDEADAALGDRNSKGDSGVDNRVFATLAAFMANANHRGKIIWFLLTARPDLLPVDLKRQGRAEEHIALFYPETMAEKRELMAVMLKKTKVRELDARLLPDSFYENLNVHSGADLEAALTRAKFRAAAEGQPVVSEAILVQTLADFIPPSYPEEIELMNLVAVLECTSRALLPAAYRKLSRAEIVARVAELKRQLG